MKRQVIVTDWRSGTTRAAYVDLGPGRAVSHQAGPHGLLTRPLDSGVMTRGTKPPDPEGRPR